MSTPEVPAWDGLHLADLLALETLGPLHYRNRCGDANAHGRAYGGQILGQALVAAAQTVDAGRAPTMMQFLFLQGTLHAQAIDLQVTALQDGKRFSSRHVRGTQGAGRAVLDAQVTFALPMPAPEHSAPAPFPAGEDPASLPTLAELPSAWASHVQRAGGYTFEAKPSLDFRIAEVPDGLRLDRSEPRLRFWVRLRHALASDSAVLHAGAFAYLSDWWLNFPAPGAHLADLDGGGLYIASLNHAIWFHRPLDVDEWLHFDSVSPAAAAGRGFSVARVHDRSGRLVASATQECLMAPRD